MKSIFSVMREQGVPKEERRTPLARAFAYLYSKVAVAASLECPEERTYAAAIPKPSPPRGSS
ncbi:hypothetical protein H0H93_001067 [Arthromyces matolae]|nr:hypothetical protein H0H93_001067 [Arthromyces matolae]